MRSRAVSTGVTAAVSLDTSGRYSARRPATALRHAVTIGNFDGVHLGHQAMLSRLKSEASALGVPACVLTFEPHPADVFAGRPVIFRLTPPDAKAAQAQRLGLDGMIVLTFDGAFSKRPARDFTQDILSEHLGLSAVVAGYDFRFGAGRTGDAEFLRAEGARLGFAVEIGRLHIRNVGGIGAA
jgi:riboflavin kinase/FMN adenylyltransferase